MKTFYKIFILLAVSFGFAFGGGFDSNFYNIKDAQKRKEEFVKILTPLIEKTNESIITERKAVERYFKKVRDEGIENINEGEKIAIKAIAKKYRIDSIEDKKQFDEKVAPVPVSLAIAQAAIESGWGSSRFTKEANNLYGQWIWTDNDKLGLVPANREEGKKHRIRIFNSLQSSVNSYMLNLNRHDAYKDFRKLRLEQKQFFTGLEAAEGMESYSEIRGKYVNILKDVMKANRLVNLDILYKELLQANEEIFIQPLS